MGTKPVKLNDATIYRNAKNVIETVKTFKLLKVLGSGQFGTVYEGVNPKGQSFAIKKISINDPQQLLSQLEEIRVQGLFDHPNVVKLYEAFVWPDKVPNPNLYLVLELCDTDLDTILKGLSSKTLKDNVIISWFVQLLGALNEIHSKGVIHRDLKPQNIMVCSVKDQFVLKIADFGISRTVSANNNASTLCGSPIYMGPEILNQSVTKYDNRVDSWSLGIIFIQVLLGVGIESLAPLIALTHRITPDLLIAVLNNQVSDRGVLTILSQMLCTYENRKTSTDLWNHPIVIGWKTFSKGEDWKDCPNTEEGVMACSSSLNMFDGKSTAKAFVALGKIQAAVDKQLYGVWCCKTDVWKGLLSLLGGVITIITPSNDIGNLFIQILFHMEIVTHVTRFNMTLSERLLQQRYLTNDLITASIKFSLSVTGKEGTCLNLIFSILDNLFTSNHNFREELSLNSILLNLLIKSAEDFPTAKSAAVRLTPNITVKGIETVMNSASDEEWIIMLENFPSHRRSEIVSIAITWFVKYLPKISKLEEAEKIMSVMRHYIENSWKMIQICSVLQLCTYSVTQTLFESYELFFQDITCFKQENFGVCHVCAHKCHAGHNLVFLPTSSASYCDCIEQHQDCKATKPEPFKLVNILQQQNENQFNVARLPKGLRISTSNVDILRVESREKLNAISSQPIANITSGGGESAGYFEIQCLKPGKLAALGIGVGPSDFSNTSFPGQQKDSVGYHSDDGNCYWYDTQKDESQKFEFGPRYQSGDVVGCGVTNKGHVYFTKNGILIGVCTRKILSGNVYGIIGTISIDASIRVNWGKEPFAFQRDLLAEYFTAEKVPLCVFSEAVNALKGSSNQPIAPLTAVGNLLISSNKPFNITLWKRISAALSQNVNPQTPAFVRNRKFEKVSSFSGGGTPPRNVNPQSPEIEHKGLLEKLSQLPAGRGRPLPFVPQPATPPRLSTIKDSTPIPVVGTLTQATQLQLPQGMSPDINSWTKEDVCLWMSTLKLNQDYSNIIKSNGIDGEVLLNDLNTQDDFNAAGITVFGDVRKLLRAKTSVMSLSQK